MLVEGSCRNRKPISASSRGCLSGQGKVRFSREEDGKLLWLINEFGASNWEEIAGKMNSRSARQCRERYKQHLDPSLKQGEWSRSEDVSLLQLFEKYGNSWNLIAKHYEGRSRIAVRNRYFVIKRGIVNYCEKEGVAESRKETAETVKNEVDLFDEGAFEWLSDVEFYAGWR